MYNQGLIEAAAKSLAGKDCSCFDAKVTRVEPLKRGEWAVYMTGTCFGEQKNLLAVVHSVPGDEANIEGVHCQLLN
jgi:hypothetical protein